MLVSLSVSTDGDWSCCRPAALACVLQPWTPSYETQFLCWRHFLGQFEAAWDMQLPFLLQLSPTFNFISSQRLRVCCDGSTAKLNPKLMQEVWVDLEIFCGFILIWDRTCKLNPLYSLSTSLWVPVIWLQLDAVFLLQSDNWEEDCLTPPQPGGNVIMLHIHVTR